MKPKPLVLSIDDDLNFSKLLELVLVQFGIDIKSFSNSHDFLEAARSLQPDLYLIDLLIENENGLELIKTLKHEFPKSFVVVISGRKDPKIVAQALEFGASDYLFKPLERVLLATKLSQFIETKEINDHRSEWKPLSQRRFKIKVQFKGSIEEVDELGIKFNSSTLTPKGTVLRLSSHLFEEIGLKMIDCLVTVTSNWHIPETQKYGAYAEFDGVDTEFLQTLRLWLSKQTSNPEAVAS